MNATPPTEKIESACKMVNQINRGFMRTRASSLSIIAMGKVADSADSEERLPIDDLKTIVSMYMTDLTEQWSAIVAGRDALGRIYTDLVISTAIDRTAKKPTSDEVNTAFSKADKACDEFLAKAYALARSYQ